MKTVLITGAGGGLGRALVDVFERNGWYIYMGVRDFSVNDDYSLEINDGGLYYLDLTNQQSIKEFAQKRKVHLDVIIHNAGIYDSPADNETMISSMEEYSRVFQTNVIGARMLTDLLLPRLMEGTEKLVVGISSVMGTFAALDEYNAKHWSYSASKLALNYALMAFHTSHPDITCGIVHPGWMKTKIGGKDAPIEPKDSAEKIFRLITEHRILNGKLIDTDGKELPL